MDTGTSATPALEPTGFRLSPPQERWWTLYGAALPNVSRTCGAVKLRGALEVARLQAALQQVVAEHEILRTTFPRAAGVRLPWQVIQPSAAFAFTELAAPKADEEANEEADELAFGAGAPAELFAELCAEGGAAEVAALTSSPALRVVLQRHAPERSTLWLSLPALCADARGWHNLVAEIIRAYAAAPEAAPPVQYADAAEYLHELLTAEDTAEGRRFWAQRWPAPSDATAARLANLSDKTPRVWRWSLSAALAQELTTRTAEQNSSVAAWLYAAWLLLWSRLQEQSALLAGLAVAGRTLPELQPALGLFAKLTPLSVALPSALAFNALAQRLATAQQDAELWQDYCAAPPADTAAPMAWPCAFSFAELPPPIEVAGVEFISTPPLCQFDRAQVWLDCVWPSAAAATERPAPPQFALHYVPASSGAVGLDEAAAQQLAERFELVLRQALAQPDLPLGEFDLVTPRERQQLLHDWQGPAASYAQDRCLHELFTAQAQRTPDAVAVRYAGRELTYGELEQHANRLARRLRAHGAGPERVVALCAERSLELVVGLLGILKAGSAYLPLDPTYPPDRLAFMLADVAAPLLLTQTALQTVLPAVNVPVLWLDDVLAAVAETSQESATEDAAFATAVMADNLAYVIYTSGSTGRPKGVQVTHRSIGNRLLWMQAEFPLNPADKVIQKTPYSFDASIWEFFVPWLAGAQVVLAKPGGHQDAGYLAELIAAEQVTILQLVPSMLQVFLEEPGVAACQSLRRVFCGGEALPLELQARCRARLNAELVNLYGPTEAAIDATFWRCDGSEAQALGLRGGNLPIGRSLPSMEAYVLDAELRLLPVGVVGELHLGGIGLARGYWRRPGATAEKFIPHPFSATPGARLYKSGDQARRLANGAIEFLGRGDDQVKIRGFRIELGEIESALQQHSAVRSAVVLAATLPPNDKRLVAFVVPHAGRAVTPEELRNWVSTRLPAYMTPGEVRLLETLPSAPNGKLDRRALQQLAETPAPVDAAAFVGPRTPTEELLAGIWAQVLGLPRLSIHADFFQHGGHSLLAAQVVARTQEALQIRLPLRALFETPTVAGLAPVLDEALRTQRGTPLPPLQPVPRKGPLPLSYGQARLWFLAQLKPDSTLHNIPVVVRLTGELDVAALTQALTALTARHEVLRTRFAEQDGAPVQVIAAAAPVDLPLVDLADWPAPQRFAAAQRLAQVQAEEPFDLSAAAPWRVQLVRLSATEHVLTLVLHHIITDGWSSALLVRELGQLYAAARTGSAAELPELPIQYADYAQWQRDWLSGPVLAEQVNYWRQQLAGAPPVLQLPQERPRSAQPSQAGATESFALDESVVAGLRTLSREAGTTLFMTLLAGFKALLLRYTGQTDFVIGTDVANRQRRETENVLGFFVNEVPLRTDLSGDPSFTELLQRVRAVTLDAYAQQDLPFNLLVEELRPARSLEHAPIFQVKFLLQHAQSVAAANQELALQSLELVRSAAEQALVWDLLETPDGLHGHVDYRLDWFDRATIQLLVRQYQTLLASIVAAPAQRLSELRTLAETAAGAPAQMADLSQQELENLLLELEQAAQA